MSDTAHPFLNSRKELHMERKLCLPNSLTGSIRSMNFVIMIREMLLVPRYIANDVVYPAQSDKGKENSAVMHSHSPAYLLYAIHGLILNRTTSSGTSLQQRAREWPGISWPHPLVQADSNTVLRVDLAVKVGLEISMGTQRLLEIAAPAAPSPQRQGLVPLDILAIKEHVTDRDDLLVDVVWVAGKDHTLGDDTVR